MSFGHHTPESLLPRSDSKNPATTCKGITQSGRPCRRPLSASPSASPAASPGRGYGVLAVLQDGAGHHSNAAAFYCWQHRDQADQLQTADATRTKLYPLKEKSSIDTLVDRLGVLDLDEDVQKQHRHRRRKQGEHALKKRDTMPTGWQQMQSPLMTVPEGFERPEYNSKPRTRPTHGRSNLKASFLCCLKADDDDSPPARPSQNRRRPQAPEYRQPQAMSYCNPTGRPNGEPTAPKIQPPLPIHRKNVPGQPHLPPNPPPQPRPLLSLIPPHLPPLTIAALLSELSRPLTTTDLTTSGYIYIFWLTPSSIPSAPDSDIASTILDDGDGSPGPGSTQEQLLQRYSSERGGRALGAEKRTILLKIGRAINVHRRMNQWQRQCGHEITLLRYYPNSNTTQPTQESTPKATPLLPRVERLIQLELGGMRFKQEKCSACGREHREWFEVEASRRGVRDVDEVVRRWVGWGFSEGRGNGKVEGEGGYY
jgi:hypothetical protein